MNGKKRRKEQFLMKLMERLNKQREGEEEGIIKGVKRMDKIRRRRRRTGRKDG